MAASSNQQGSGSAGTPTRPLWKRALLLGSLLVVMTAVAASGYWLAGRRVWTDGQSLRMPASEANLREVLIRADERSYMQYFAAVAAQCRAAGVKQFKIGFLEGGK